MTTKRLSDEQLEEKYRMACVNLPGASEYKAVLDECLARGRERDEERKHYELAMQLNDDYLARAEWAEAKVARLTECLDGNCNKPDRLGQKHLCRGCWNRIAIGGLEGKTDAAK